MLERVEALGWEPLTIAVLIALLAGMRRVEIRALRRQGVDFTNSILHVDHALTQTSQSGGYKTAEPKVVSSASSRRQFPMGPETRRWLGSLRRRQRAGVQDFVLTGTDRWHSPDILLREWRMLAKSNWWRGF